MQMLHVRGVATQVFTNEEAELCVQYHSTIVVKWNDEKIVLNSGGWRTNTTKARMNQASNEFRLGYQVYQKDYEWFVAYNGEVLKFEDNMVIDRV